jgi:signal transduction histidine kinase
MLVGLIAIFTPHALHERGEAEPILQIFSTRVAGEMRQARTDAALRQSEHRLFQSEKIEAVGRLAGGVAHDFNNLLTIILGYGHELRRHVPSEPGASHLEEMVAAADRAKELTRQLLAFSRQQVLQPRAVSLDEIIGSVQSMLRRLIGEDITIVTSAASRGAFIHADPGQLSQVLLNLAVNARDAMPLGGTLSISTERIVVKHARHVRLTVSDTGHGMDEATLARIFDPFFSTKGSLGTGLGLATVYGIVRQSGGSISCKSEPGRGTTFTIDFPETERPASEPGDASGERRPEPPLERGREPVLLVEDEAPVRNFLASVLERRGYDVRTAGSAAEALQMLKGGWVPRVLITDFVMPGGTSGVELAALAATVCPGIRTVLMSGYAKQPEDGPAELKVQAFLQKPFTPDALDATIRDVLNRTPQP